MTIFVRPRPVGKGFNFLASMPKKDEILWKVFKTKQNCLEMGEVNNSGTGTILGFTVLL